MARALKTSGTIIEKLSRERHPNLRIIRDLAGARIVKRMTLDEQDVIASQMLGIWPDARIIDRREAPSHGYRAIHIVPKVDGCQVEVQLRTEYQDLWAQGMERFGDVWGRNIRYGGDPDNPDEIPVNASVSRREMIATWKSVADQLHELAQIENSAARLRQGEVGAAERAELDALETEMNTRFRHVKGLVEELRNIFG